MSRKSIRFERMQDPYIYGYEAESELGVQVEVVQCYEGAWNVFLTREGKVVARSVAEWQACQDGYLGRKEAFDIARKLVGQE